MGEQRFEFVVVPDLLGGYVATFGDYDLGEPTGHGDTPSAAIIDWLEMHEDTINDR